MKFRNRVFSKIITLTLLAAVTLFSACKDDDDDDTEVTYNLTLSAGQPSDDGSEITEGEYWVTGDKVTAINCSLTREYAPMTYNSGSNTFSTTMVDLLSTNNMAFFYPSDALPIVHSDTVTYSIDVQGQDGTVSTRLRYKYGYSSSLTLNDQSATASVTMQAILANVHMDFQINGMPINDIVRMDFRAAEGNVYGKRTFNFRKQAFEAGTYNTMTIKNGNGLDGIADLAMLPTDNVLLSVTLRTKDGQAFTGIADRELALEMGHAYDLLFECEESNAVAHVGDYYYSDLTVSTELNENKKCIGIVFALTDTEDGAINRNLTESLHGRIVALKDLNSGGKTWSTKIFDIPQMPNYTTVDGKLEEGFLPYWEGESATSYFDDGHINISLTEDGRIENWPSSGLLSDFNGKENTAYADTSSVYYGACGGAVTYSISGIGSKRWYCPSGGEMALLYAQHRIGLLTNATKPTFTDFESRGYWVCAEEAENRAWYIQFSTGGVYSNYKLSTYLVRPLMHF